MAKAKKSKTKKPAAKKSKVAAKKKPAKRTTAKKTTKTRRSAKHETLDSVIGDGLVTGSRAERAAAVKDVKKHPRYAATYKAVLAAFRDAYPMKPAESDAKILATDPNDYDRDPSPFYEWLEMRFGVPGDPDNEYFNGYGGPIRDLIAFLTPRWDGKLRGSASMWSDE